MFEGRYLFKVGCTGQDKAASSRFLLELPVGTAARDLSSTYSFAAAVERKEYGLLTAAITIHSAVVFDRF